MKNTRFAALISIGLAAAYPESAAAQAATTPVTEPSAPPATEVTVSAPVSETTSTVQMGRIQGVVVDEATGETMIEARVTVEGLEASALTNLDGRYELDLPPGTYTIRVSNPPYTAKTVTKVGVKAEHATVVDVALSAKDDAVETVAVVADPDRTRAHIQLLIRKKAPVVSDILSAEEMAKGSDGTASEAVKRATGASVVGGKYIYVRGLGERYSYSMLNNLRIPSPEPDKQVVPLDLFPTGVLSNVTIVKTGSADLPGDFAGGAVKIETKQFPDQRLFQASLSMGGNSITTFRKYLTYKGGSLDYLGFDDSTRSFPESVPSEGRLYNGSQIGNRRLTERDMTLIGREFNNDFSIEKKGALPNLGAALTYGDTLELAGRDLGVLASASYGSSFQRTQERQTVYRIVGTESNGGLKLDSFTDYEGERGTFAVHWSGLGNLSYQVGRNHRIGYTTLYTRLADKEARHLEGKNDEIGLPVSYDRLYYVTRSLWFNKLQGSHEWPAVSIDWRAGYSEAVREEPDLRELTRTVNDRGQLAWYAKSSSGGHFFSEMVEPGVAAGLDATIPFQQWSGLSSSVKTGILETQRVRRFDVRRFRFLPMESGDPNLYVQDPARLFSDPSIGSNIFFEEASRSSDNYRAEQIVHAGYAMTDLALSSRLRLIGGLRIEQANQEVKTLDPYAPKVTPIMAKLSDTDLLPSANLVYGLSEKMNLRAGVSKTIARPEFRELAPFSFADFYGGQEVYGNPDLKRTTIQNFDLRWEMFPASGEVLAVSAFYKRLKDPIEEVIIPSSSLARSYANADRATNLGVEIEAKRGLKAIHPLLREFYGATNITLVRSRVLFGDTKGQAQTNDKRPLQGQSEYLVNAALGYEGDMGTNAQLTYNVFGKRIAQVGALGLPDVYELPRHSLDATLSQALSKNWDIKASLENLADEAVILEQGGNLVERSYKGINYGLGVSYKL